MNKDSFMIHINESSNKLLINFPSKFVNLDKTEFWGTFTKLKYSHLHVIDRKKIWYQDQSFIDTAINKINKTITELQPDQVIFFGCSMGGYGALLFSQWCICDKVVSIVPQVDLRQAIDNSEHLDGHLTKKQLIHPSVANIFKNNTTYKIITGDKFDVLQTTLFPTISNIEIKHEMDTHLIPNKWREQGILIEKIQELLNK